MKSRGFEIVSGWENKGINIPERKTAKSAGYDIEAAEDIVIPPYEVGMKPTLIPTGLKAYCQEDEWYSLAPKSSTPKKYGIAFPHSFGIIDSDYYNNEDNEGHIMIQCINISGKEVTIHKGDSVAQVIFQKFLTVDDDQATGVRKGGFGSTSNN